MRKEVAGRTWGTVMVGFLVAGSVEVDGGGEERLDMEGKKERDRLVAFDA